MELRTQVAVTVAPAAFEDPKTKATKPSKLKGSRALPITIHSAQGVFEQTTMRLTFSGGATAEQDQDVMSGDNLTAILNEKNKLQKIEMRVNSYLCSMEVGHYIEALSVDMSYILDDDQRYL